MYRIIDYYENPLGEVIFETKDYPSALSLVKLLQDGTIFKHNLRIEECSQKQAIINDITKEIAETAKKNAQKIMKNY